jgi:AraC-like DNA-binding protein
VSAPVDVEPRSKGQLSAETGQPVHVARRVAEGPAAAFARHYWLPRWSLPDGTSVRQDVLEYPTANVVIEGDSALLLRAHRGLSTRMLDGSGWAFGALLRPGTARAWTGASLRGAPFALTLRDLALPSTDSMVAQVGERMAGGDDDAAVVAFQEWLALLPTPGPDSRLVDDIVAAVESDRALLRVEQLAEQFGLGVRHLQRLVAGHIGFGPKWLIQRYRLQEAAAALRSDEPPQLATLAAELGYADQAHFSREFKTVVGATPGAYAQRERSTRSGPDGKKVPDV